MLPLYRGPAPIQHTIADGKTKTGVCILEMKEKSVGIDCGELWGVQEVVSLLNSNPSIMQFLIAVTSDKGYPRKSTIQHTPPSISGGGGFLIS